MASCCVRAVMVSATAFMCVTRPLRSVAMKSASMLVSVTARLCWMAANWSSALHRRPTSASSSVMAVTIDSAAVTIFISACTAWSGCHVVQRCIRCVTPQEKMNALNSDAIQFVEASGRLRT